MKRSKKRCPYCGKRISYFSAYFSRRKAQYVCPRCGKESRVVINKIIIPIFIIVSVISLAVMGCWFLFKLTSNPMGIVLVALPLVIFGLISPNFVQLEPLKKYQKSMEAKKAGIEYSDNLFSSELEEDISASTESGSSFKINADLFNQIKSDRTSAKEQAESDNIISNSEQIEKENYVRVIDNVSENHAGSSVPLKKINPESTRVIRPRHYIPQPEQIEEEDDVKEYKRPDTNKYSANRRF